MPSRPHKTYAQLRAEVEGLEKKCAQHKRDADACVNLLGKLIEKHDERHEFQGDLEGCIRAQTAISIIEQALREIDPEYIAASRSDGLVLLGQLHRILSTIRRNILTNWATLFPILLPHRTFSRHNLPKLFED
jgi:hypothetical protein